MNAAAADGQRRISVEPGSTSRFRSPAPWKSPAAVWLAWPHNRETWPDRFDAIPKFFRRWVELIAESTPVRVLASGQAMESARSMIGSINNVELVDIPTNDCWIRDFGPTFIFPQEGDAVEAVHWRYNAWGGKYPPWDLDQAATPALCAHANIPCHTSELCLEGGAIETDGSGRLLTTPGCLVTATRNPGWSADDVARELYRWLGVEEILWLDGGPLEGDDTDGHIDQLARFINSENIVAAVCDDHSDPNHPRLEDNYRQLHLWGDVTSPHVQTHRLPIPPARHVHGQRVPESYCNFQWLGRDRLLVPTFDAPSDDAALGLLKELTGADVVGVDCRDLVWGLGALHCASTEQPAG